MTYTGLLKSQGLTKEQIAAIMLSMKENRIFITKEEKIEERYQKLRQQKNDMKIKLDIAAITMADLKKAVTDNEELKKMLQDYEEKIATLKKDYEEKVKEMVLKEAILTNLADARYPELLISKFDLAKLSIDVNGTISGIDGQLKIIKDTYKELFPNQLINQTLKYRR